MQARLLSLIVFLSLGLAACTTVSSVKQAGGEKVSQPAVELPQENTVSAETLGGAAALLEFGHPVSALGLPGEVFNNKQSALLYILYDPLAPNWTIQEKPLNEDTYYLSLKAKSFRVGGDGESLRIIKRRALQLQREKGYDGYRILDYSESIESSTPLTHRVSEGTVQLVRAHPPAVR